MIIRPEESVPVERGGTAPPSAPVGGVDGILANGRPDDGVADDHGCTAGMSEHHIEPWEIIEESDLPAEVRPHN